MISLLNVELTKQKIHLNLNLMILKVYKQHAPQSNNNDAKINTYLGLNSVYSHLSSVVACGPYKMAATFLSCQ